jgi:hypothetical protein
MFLELPLRVRRRLLFSFFHDYELIPLFYVCRTLAAILSERGGAIVSKPLVKRTAARGHLSLLKWLHSNKYDVLTHEIYSIAAGGGNIKMLEWLDEIGCPVDTEEAASMAAASGRIEVLKMLFPRFINPHNFSRNVIYSAAVNGRIDVLDFVRASHLEHVRTYHLEDALVSSQRRGIKESVDWLKKATGYKLLSDKGYLEERRVESLEPDG